MKPMRYDPQVKATIVAAVQDARKAGKKWSEAFEIAKKAGYRGTEGGLYQLVNPAKSATKAAAPKPVEPELSVTKAKAAPAPAPAKVKAPKGKPGPKAKPATAPVVKAPVAPAPSGPLDITALVHKAVTDAVVSALESLLATLKKS